MMRPRNLLLFSLCLSLLAACGLPPAMVVKPPQSQNVSYNQLVTPDPQATITPTPFQPAEIEAVQTPIPSIPTKSGPTATPTEILPSPTPTVVPLINRLKRPDGLVTILIFGSDYRPQSGYRTDVMMLLSINTKKGTASLVSFPRDLYVDIPGWEMQRLNTAHPHGGFELTQKTFELNFGVHPDHYIMTNFDGFKGIIDTLGGVDVYASRGLSDTCDLPQAVDRYCNVSPGRVHMDGATALWYVRSRHSTSDFDRTRRAQEVIQAVFLRLLSLNAVSRAPELYSQFKSSVETDLALNDILPILPLAPQFADVSVVERYAISPSQAPGWTTPGGGAVLVPNEELIFDEIISKAVYGQ